MLSNNILWNIPTLIRTCKHSKRNVCVVWNGNTGLIKYAINDKPRVVRPFFVMKERMSLFSKSVLSPTETFKSHAFNNSYLSKYLRKRYWQVSCIWFGKVIFIFFANMITVYVKYLSKFILSFLYTRSTFACSRLNTHHSFIYRQFSSVKPEMVASVH